MNLPAYLWLFAIYDPGLYNAKSNLEPKRDIYVKSCMLELLFDIANSPSFIE